MNVMASKEEGDRFKDLICPLCLEIFENATLLSCGHTFCRKCLERCDKAHKAYNDIECPLCRRVTPLDKKARVTGLPPNVAINGLVEQIRDDERQQQLLLTDQSNELCSRHAEKETIYCTVCEEMICLSCFVESHQGHEISKKEDIEKNVKERTNNLFRRCEERKKKIEQEIDICKEHRKELHSSVQKAEMEIAYAFHSKIERLQQLKHKIQEETEELKESQSSKLDHDINNHRKIIADIDGLYLQLENTSKMSLDSSSIAIFSVLVDELEDLLTQEESFEETTKKSDENGKVIVFSPADDKFLVFGKVKIKHEKRTNCPKNSEQSTVGQESLGATITGIVSSEEESTESSS